MKITGTGKPVLMLDQYKTSADSMFVSYIRPQETGNRTDVRWVSLTNNSGIGLMAIGSSLFRV